MTNPACEEARHRLKNGSETSQENPATEAGSFARGFWRRSRPWRRAMRVAAFVLVPFVMLGVIALIVAYVRLANGPVSLSFLAPAIEHQIAEKFGGLRVAISDVVLSLTDDGAKLQVSDVRVRDEHDALVAQAPTASIDIDRRALLAGRVSPTGIILIQPHMHLAYSDRDGLALSFDSADAASPEEAAPRAADAGQAAVAGRDPAEVPRPSGEAGRIAVLQTLSQLVRESPGRRSAATLDRIGVRNAIIELDHNGRKSRFGVPSGDLVIKHQSGGAVVSGLATFAEAQGQNIVAAFHAGRSEGSHHVQLRATVSNLMPGMLARISPAFELLRTVSIPVAAELHLNLSDAGGVSDGRLTAELGAGSLGPSDSRFTPPRLDHGRIALRFSEGSSDITVEPSTLSWGGGNQLTVAGRLSHVGAGRLLAIGAQGSHVASGGLWQYELDSVGGRFVAAPGGKLHKPVDEWSATGSMHLDTGEFVLDRLVVGVAGGRTVLKGRMIWSDLPTFALEGRVGPGPVGALAYVWPDAIAPDARRWLQQNVHAGRLTGGQLSAGGQLAGLTDAALGGGASRAAPLRTSLALQATNLRFAAVAGMPATFAERALLRMTDEHLEFTMPTAQLASGRTRALALKQVRFDIADVYADDAAGELRFVVDGALRDAGTVLASPALADSISKSTLNLLRERAAGQIAGGMSIRLPLASRADWSPTATGKLKLADVRIKSVIAGRDVEGGRFELDIASKSLDARGEMLINGVAASMAWHHILGAPAARQPPIRLEASLSEADREKLGIKINHMMRGDLGVAVSLTPRPNGKLDSHVRADATKAEIIVESLAWVKPVGRYAQIEFDIETGPGKPVSLENLQMVGDGIAIQGRAELDRKNQLRSFELPRFSIDRVTRLDIKGALGKGNVWRVAVNGQTFEGRNFFRSLFNAGQIRRQAASSSANRPGVDLEARITTVLGHWNAKLSNVALSLSKRSGKIISMQASGMLAGNHKLEAAVRTENGRRLLQATATDAGQAFQLAGFYPNARRGRMELAVALDGQGAAERFGELIVRKFRILGDQVVGEMAQVTQRGIDRRTTGVERANNALAIDFDWMRLPFVVGNGQFILRGAELRGPVVGATIEGKADFAARHIDLTGTYVPLQGLNGALGIIPGIGQILAGPNGEGVLGMKYAVRGAMNGPEILVNPLSLMTPGIFREIFQMSNPSLEVTERSTTRAAPANRGARRKTNQPGGWASEAFGGHN